MQIRIAAAGSVAFPLTSNRVLSPRPRENFAYIYSIVVRFPVLEPHPPISIQLKRMIETFFQTFVVVPRLIFISKCARPHAIALSPRITHVNELKSLHVRQIRHLEHAICFVILNSLDSVPVNWLAIILDAILANDNEALLVRLSEVFPKLTGVNWLLGVVSGQIIFFGHAASHVN